jgi:hypothetical protein
VTVPMTKLLAEWESSLKKCQPISTPDPYRCSCCIVISLLQLGAAMMRAKSGRHWPYFGGTPCRTAVRSQVKTRQGRTRARECSR